MKWKVWAAHSGIFRLFSSTNTPCSTAVGGCWWCDIGLDFRASAGSRGNTGQPGPTALKLSVTQDPALDIYPEIHIDLSSSIGATPSWKKLKFNFSLPSVLWQFTIPHGSPFHKKKKLSECSFVFHLLVKVYLLPISGVIGSILPLSPLLFTERVEKHSWEKWFISGFWMDLGTSL